MITDKYTGSYGICNGLHEMRRVMKDCYVIRVNNPLGNNIKAVYPGRPLLKIRTPVSRLLPNAAPSGAGITV